MRTLGWLADAETDVIGGAELCVRRLEATRPEDVEIVRCPPGHVVEGLDGYAIHNCTTYRFRDVEPILNRPVVKVVYEQWPHGDPLLRRELLNRSAVALFLSPPHLEQFPYPVGCPVRLMPTIVDLSSFAAFPRPQERRGTIWLAQMTSAHKGVEEAVAWAEEHGEVVDFYGGGPMRPAPGKYVRDRGQIPWEQVPVVMAEHQRFLFLPRSLDTCSRTIFEARAAGLELVVNENCGAMWWIRNRPDLIEQGHRIFWDTVRETICPTM